MSEIRGSAPGDDAPGRLLRKHGHDRGGHIHVGSVGNDNTGRGGHNRRSGHNRRNDHDGCDDDFRTNYDHGANHDHLSPDHHNSGGNNHNIGRAL